MNDPDSPGMFVVPHPAAGITNPRLGVLWGVGNALRWMTGETLRGIEQKLSNNYAEHSVDDRPTGLKADLGAGANRRLTVSASSGSQSGSST
jgi:hypothetical protein